MQVVVGLVTSALLLCACTGGSGVAIAPADVPRAPAPQGARVQPPLPSATPTRPPAAPVAQAAPEPAPSRESQPAPVPEPAAEPPTATEIPFGGSRSRIGTTAGTSPAAWLLLVSSEPGPAGVEVSIQGDGAFSYSAFRLAGPDRLVIDVEGVKSRIQPVNRLVGMGPVLRIRTGRFRESPPVVRVVVDLEHAVDIAVENAHQGLRLTFLR